MFVPESVSGVVFSNDRKSVLLIERRDVPVWVLPGGGIDPGETAERAIMREILEETGFHVKIIRLVGIYTPINRLAKLTHLYECEIYDGKASLSAETKGVRFYPLEDLPIMPPPFPEWIEDGYQKGPLIKRALTSVNYVRLLKYVTSHPILVVRFLLARMGWAINSKN